ncbi:MAG: AMP-binding protein [Cellvibrionaceae bacterium]|nr:AMP-binding protein [Cellvibrionaceae bacterium]
MIERHPTLQALVEHTFSRFKQNPAYTCLGHTLSYHDVDQLSLQFAKYLHHSLGLKPGDRLAVQLPNLLHFPVVMYGAIRAGVVMTALNPLYTEREVEHQLKDCGARALVVLENVASSAAKVLENTPVERVIVARVGDLHPLPKRLLINFVVRYVKKQVPPFEFKNSISFRECLNISLPPLPNIEMTPEDTAVLQYTGGTTGVAKGAVLSHHNLTSNVWQVLTHLPEVVATGKGVFLACLPLYHIFAFNLHALCGFAGGCHNVLIPNPRQLDTVIKSMAEFPVAVFIGINTLITALCRDPEFRKLDFSSLMVSAAGGMALTKDAAENWHKITGCAVCEGYGLSETSPVVSSNQPKDIHLGTIGIPVPETEVRIIGNEDQVLGPMEAGELCVRGPQVMQGYWQRADETAKALSPDGWFRTGDIAVINEQGRLKIVDRKKDMILVSGFNVYPNEIEDVVSLMPEVLEAAAIGIPDPDCGEKVKLFVVADQDGTDEQKVRQFCKTKLTAYKVPSLVEFRDSLPKSPVGKILRKELRNL